MAKEANQFMNDLIRNKGRGSSVAESEEFQAMWLELQETLESVIEAAEQLTISVEALPQSEAKGIVQDHLEDLVDDLTGPVITAVDAVETALGLPEDDLLEPTTTVEDDDDVEEDE
jgi:hypothetical protein